VDETAKINSGRKTALAITNALFMVAAIFFISYGYEAARKIIGKGLPVIINKLITEGFLPIHVGLFLGNIILLFLVIACCVVVNIVQDSVKTAKEDISYEQDEWLLNKVQQHPKCAIILVNLLSAFVIIWTLWLKA